MTSPIPIPMTRRSPPSDGPHRRRAGRPHWPAHALVVVVALLLLPTIADARASSYGPQVGISPDLPGAKYSPIVTVTNSVDWTMNASFWGADLRVYYPLGPVQGSWFNATPISFVRWPGGSVAESYNYTSNLIYADNGTSYSPPSNESQFVTWCRSVGCHAILQLPAEIDSPATAASYVQYTLSVLHFRPAYWEIGNEPARWTHFGFPWSKWNTSQIVNATPGTYASTVQAYAKAIRAIEPHVRLIGLGGVGTGGFNEATWIKATVRLNGPNISAVAIHVYPAGGTTLKVTANLSNFFDSLAGSGSLPTRIPRDRSAILSACGGSCSYISLFVTELGSGTSGGPYAKFMATFPSVPFTAAEVAQAIQGHVPNVDLYALQSNYSGSLLNSTGAPTLIETLYSQLLVHLEPVVLNCTLSVTPAYFYVTAARNGAGTAYSLLAVNANNSHAIQINFAGIGFPIAHAGSAWSWNSSSLFPVSVSWSAAGLGPTSFVLPSRSVLVIQVT